MGRPALAGFGIGQLAQKLALPPVPEAVLELVAEVVLVPLLVPAPVLEFVADVLLVPPPAPEAVTDELVVEVVPPPVPEAALEVAAEVLLIPVLLPVDVLSLPHPAATTRDNAHARSSRILILLMAR